MAEYPSKMLGGRSQLGMLAAMLAMENNLITYPFRFRGQPLDDPNVITLKENEYRVWEENWDRKRKKYIEWKEGWDKRRKVED